MTSEEQSEDYGPLIEWLKERGHQDHEIDQILAQVRVYEKKMQNDSVMDSIGAGRLSLDAIIQEALGSDPE